jgi:hypothetical protein
MGKPKEWDWAAEIPDPAVEDARRAAEEAEALAASAAAQKQQDELIAQMRLEMAAERAAENADKE